MEHLFDVEMAKKYGVKAAILIRHFQFWIIKNKANGKHYHEGRTWTYCSVKALTKIFPYWSTRQVRVILDNLLEQEVIIKGKYNPKGYDRTTWYAFKDENTFVKSDKCICQIGQKDLSDPTNASARNDQPITDTIPNTNKDDSTYQLEVSAEERLNLDLLIAEQKKFFIEQVVRIFQPSKKEMQTFANITRHLVMLAQKNSGNIGLFKDAVEWAIEAKQSNARNKKGLFVAKIKKETGFTAQRKLLSDRKSVAVR